MGFSINSVTLDGNLTAAPEVRETPGGMTICRLRVAHNSRRKTQEGQYVDQAHFFDVTFFGNQGAWIGNNLQKGQKVMIQGRLEWREWDDKDTGKKRSAVSILGDNISTARGEGGGGSNGGGGGYASAGGGGGFSGGSDVPVDTSDFNPPAPVGGGSSTGDDDIPF